MTLRLYDKEESIKQLRIQLEYLTNELNKITNYIQLLEIPNDGVKSDLESENEISELIRKQNTISHEIITVKKRIHRLSAKTILKVELLILPVVVVLLFFVAINSTLPIDSTTLNSKYQVEDLQGNFASNYNYWIIGSQTPLVVNIENSANLSEQKIQDVKNAITSMDQINEGSFFANKESYKGWEGALARVSYTQHWIPQIFNINQDTSGDGGIVITLSSLKDNQGYAGFTRVLTDGNQIRKVFITIYASDKLTDNELESVVRHEFGHALGLSPTKNLDGFEYDSFTTNNSYITTCDTSSLEKLYNDEKSSHDFCNN